MGKPWENHMGKPRENGDFMGVDDFNGLVKGNTGKPHLEWEYPWNIHGFLLRFSQHQSIDSWEVKRENMGKHGVSLWIYEMIGWDSL